MWLLTRPPYYIRRSHCRNLIKLWNRFQGNRLQESNRHVNCVGIQNFNSDIWSRCLLDDRWGLNNVASQRICSAQLGQPRSAHPGQWCWKRERCWCSVRNERHVARVLPPSASWRRMSSDCKATILIFSQYDHQSWFIASFWVLQRIHSGSWQLGYFRARKFFLNYGLPRLQRER